ncbi:MAG TPA: DUF5718 family protein [Campylobacterales bacterium]|nr:DUF5718 family protein [Campylobacterales bacterium]
MNFANMVGIGVAGNFAGHLEQAGESGDFADVVTLEKDAPKGVFPFYLPSHPNSFLSVFPLSSREIDIPQNADNLQAEPEVAIVCDIVYESGKVKELIPRFFGAYNDCSIRREGAKKISEKKNWGANSKGIAKKLLKVDTFRKGGMMDAYRIACHLKRDGKLHRYGVDSALSSYSYFHGKLLDWIVERINNQQDAGPLESIAAPLKECGYPAQALVSIGATRYTEFGEKGYLQKGDELFVALYPSDVYDESDVEEMMIGATSSGDDVSLLRQVVR